MALATNPVDINRSTQGLTLPTDLSNEIFAAAVEESAIMRLARNIEIPGRGLSIPVVTGDPVADFVTETAEKPVSNSTFSTKVMTPYKVAVIETFSNQFRRDYARLYDELLRRLPYALGRKIDQTAFHGAAPGTGFDTLASATTVSIGSDQFTQLVGAMETIGAAGGDMDGIALSAQGMALVMGAVDGSQRPIFTSAIDGGLPRVLGAQVVRAQQTYKAGTPNIVGYAGDWSKAVFGRVTDIDIAFSDQATLNDGTQTINLWQRNMFAVRAEFEIGFVVANAGAFVALTDASASADPDGPSA